MNRIFIYIYSFLFALISFFAFANSLSLELACNSINQYSCYCQSLPDTFPSNYCSQTLVITTTSSASIPSGSLSAAKATYIQLNGNWNSISADAFQGNTIVVTISIYNTNLPSLPAGLFSGLSSLQTISIDSNPALTSLPVGLFNESLSSLTSLTISGNNLLTQLSPNLFAGLNSVTNLNLGNSGYNRFTTLQNGVFNGLTSITTFQIYNWPELTTIEAGAFSGFTKMNHETYGNYPNIYITSNPKLTTIQPQAFAGLKLFHLQVEGNPLWVPAANTFSGVYTRELDIRTSAAISQFPSYTFNNSVVLNYLSIYNNPSLTTLVANTFTGSTISNLYIQYNPALTTILANTFDKINALGTTLILYNDVLSTIEVGAFGTYSSPTLQTLSIIGCPKIATFPLGVFSTSVSSLVSLTLSNLATLSTLPPGLFTNLTSLTSFTLRESYQLKVLQAGVFRGLSSVTNFDLGNSGANAFTILKKGVFEGLTSLVTFSIYSWNDLVTIEDEVFSDFIKMNHPAYSNYPTIYFSYNPKLATIGKNIFKDIKVYRIQFDNNPALVLQTNTFNSTYVQDLQLQSLNNMTELTPFLFNGATVYGTLGIFTMSSMINIPANAFSGSTVSAISLQNNYVLQNISAFAFNNITNLRTLNFYSNPLLAYISKDSFFSVAGNPVFTTLTLSYNAMQTLPLGVFNGLETMTTLYISNNDKLSSLPPGLFSNLTLLTSFVLNGNFQLKVLQPGTFLGLQSVTSIDLGNNYNGFTILQRGVFQGLTSLNSISISNWNNLETIEAGVFSDLTRMNHNLYSNYPSIYINNNPVLTSIEQNAFNGLSFYSLELNNNPVLALPVNVFNGSTSIYLYLRALQNMTQLPSYLFAGSIVNTLTIHYMGGLRTLLPYTFANCSVSSIFIQYNSVLASLSPLTFDKSSGIVTLYIRLNDVLWDIQPNVFGNLSSIQNLYITDNSNLTAINKGLFTAGVSTLTTLSISGLPITTLPVGGFINLTSVVNFYFSNNYQLTVIPSGALLGLSSVTSMDLNYNKIQTLQKGVFKGLDSLLNLQIYNWIELVSIEEGAFHDFPKMDYNNNYGSIYISYNPKLSKLDKNLFAVIRPYHIQIEYNPLLRLNETNIFNGTNTRELDIRGLDGVTTILPKTFSGLVIVNYLTLNYLSGLVSIASDAFTGSSIPNLYVQYNPVLATLSPLAFNNITNSYSVYIQGNNALWDISPNVFGSLTGVYSLSINDNANLSSIPFGVFGGRLSLLQSLTMVRNTKLITLSPGIFSNLTSLVNLYLYGNMNWKVLEPGVFIGLESLTNLDLGSYGNNAFTSLKKGVFAGLTRLTSISISGWSQLETIEDGVFSDLTRFNYTRYGEYSSIYIASNPLLTTISNNAFANIYPYRIQLDDNKVLTLNTGVFDNVITREIVLRQLHRINRFDSFLFATTKVLSYMSIEFMSNLTDFLPNTFYGLEVPILYIQYNPILTSFASSTFSGIKNLNTIYMYSNPSLNVFPAGLFYGLFSLQSFSVEKKYFTPIPPLSTYLSSNGNIYNCHPSCSTCFGPSSLECCPFGCNRCLTNSSCYENTLGCTNGNTPLTLEPSKQASIASLYYSSNQNCSWQLTPSKPGNYLFIIEFFTFNTQINADYLYIYNTSNNVNNLVSTLTGVYPPGSIRDITKFYYASSLSFKFITDDAVESLGWNCSVTLAATPSKCSELNYTALPLATPASVSFSTETQEYNLCSWRFAFDESTAPSPADLNIRVTLTFSAFDIGNSDRVYLYNGGTNELIASLSGNYTSSLNSISYSGYMRSILIRFEMPGGRLKPTLWNATVLFESVGCKNGLSHVDLTPFVPYTLSALNYLNNQNCQWNFTSSSVSNWSTTRYLLTAEVLQFKTEPQDYFSLSSPNSLLWKVSGSSTVSNKIFNFNGTGLLAMFTSDSFNTNTGASIRFTLAPAGSACTVANSNTTTVLAASNSKTIGASVNRTHVNYCTYNFVVAPAVLSSTYPYRTTVNFTQFDIADTDSVTIFDTSLLSTTTTPAFIVSLSGNYTSTLASLLTVLRHSQFTVQFYSFIKSNMTTSASNAWSALITTTQFGCQNSETRIQLNTTGQLASIQVVDYDIYQTCGWRVFGAAEGVSLFKIQFSSFNTRYFYDSLAVYNVTDALGTLNLLSSLSGDYNPSSAALSLYVLGTAVLKFTTQHITAATEYGWKANITLLSCSTLSQCENCMNCKFGTCNFQTGVCQCSPGFTGPTCSNCASGRYGPNCEPLIWPLSVTPSSGKDTGGTLLTVVGDNFANSSNWVCQFTSNTTLASVTVPAAWLSSTSISCVTPVNVLSGGATLRVSSDGGATFAQPVLKFLFTTVCNSTCSGNGVCLFESCRCNTGFYGSSCNLVLVLPSISVAKTEYTFEERTNIVIPIVVASGTQPFTWSLVSIPASNMIFNSTSASVVWTDIPASRTVYSVTVTATNALGSAQAVFSIRVLPLYTSSLRIAPNIQSQTLVNPPPQLQSGISLTLTGFLQLLNTSSSSLINLQLGYNLGIWIYSESTGISDLVIRIPKDSNWQATVTLSSAAAGRVVIGVRHPSVLLSEIVPFSEYQVELNVLSMRMSPADVGFRLYPGEVSIYKNSFAITNPGNTTLTAVGPSLTLGVSSPLQYVNITRADGKPWPVVIPPNGGQVLCDVSVFSLGSWYGSVHVEFNSSQGAFAREFIRLDIVNRAPQLGILYGESSNIYNMVLVRGAQLIFNVKIQNNGDGETFPMNISLPTDLAEIASVSSPASGIIPSILPGGNTILTFFATTPADYPISQFSGSIALVSNITYLYVPISLSIVSQYSVNFTVVVQDEFSFYAEGLPNLEGATVQLSSSTRGISVSYITGSDGLASFLLPEGLYDIYVTAPSHASYSSAVYVSFGSLPVTIFISRQVVKYSWTVTPTVFEDKYTFTLDATFVTSVPMPVIVVRPVAIDLDALETGLIPVINFVFENQGLIQSNNIRLTLPSHPSIQFSSALSVAGTLVIDIGPLAANSTITFPVYVSRVTGGTSRRSTQNCLQAFLESFLNCGGTPQVTTTLISFYRDGPCSYGLYSGEVSPVTSYVNFGSFGGGSSSGYSPVGITGSGSTTVTPAPVLQLPCDVCLATAVKCAAAITGTGNAYLSAASDSFGALISNSLQPLCASVISGNAGSALTILLGTFISSGTGPSSVASSQQTYSSAVGTISTCYYGIYDKCSKINGIISEYTTSIRYFTQQQQSRRATDSFSESGIKDLLTGLGQGLSYFNLHELIFGSASDSDLWLTTSITSDWKDMFFSALSESSSAGSYLSSTEFTNLVASSPLGFSSSIQMFLTRINNTLAAWETGRAPTGSSSGNFISYEEFLRAVSIFTANCFPLSNLFTTVVDASNGLLDANRNANAGVCASVKIRIVQELVLLREAFDAHLELTNDGNLPLTNISVTIQIVSTAGVVATESFVIRKPDISGSFSGNISNLAMGATLPANSVGDAHWLIAALREAAPTTSTVFKVGGTLTYVLDGQLVVIPLFPAAITVQPDPILWIDYFLEKNVFGDDPFTLDVVEPSIPYTLGLIITNTGFGSAYKLKIQSSQPSIIENERGLLINFKIIGSQIGNSTIEPTLDAALGDIAPHSTKVVRWLLTTSLMGQFVSYNASFENVNPFGEKRLCIVDSLRYHELIHAVRMEYPTDDFLIDYLANDIVDQATTPDFVYSSANGSATNPVMNLTDIFISNVETVSVDMIKVTLTVSHVSSSLTNNYVFGKVNFPPSLLFTPRFTLTKTTRNDGKVLLTENSWDFWKVNHLRSGDSIDAYISVFDYLPPSFTNSTLSYIIYYTRNGYIPPGDQEGSSAVPVATTSKISTAASSVVSSSATSKLTSASTSILAAVSTSTSVVAASSTNLYSSSSSYSSSVFSTIKSTTAAVPDVSSTGLATVAASLSTTSIYSSAAQQTSLASAATLASLASQASLASAASASSDYLASARSATSVVAVALASASAQSVASAASVASLASIASVVSVESVASVSASAASAASASSVAVHQASLATAAALASLATQASLASASSDYIASSSSVAAAALASTSAQSAASVASAVSISAASVATQYIESTRLLATHSAAVSSASAASVESVASVASVSSASAASAEFAASIASISSASAASVISASAVSAYSVSPTVVPTCIYPFVLGVNNHCKCPNPLVLYNGTCITACPSKYFASSGVCLACDSSCLNCFGGTSNQCLSCPAGVSLYEVEKSTCIQGSVCPASSPLLIASNSTCVSSCPSGMLRNSTQCVSACPIGTVSVLRTCVPGCQALREGDYVWPTTLAGLSSTQLCPPRYVNQVVRTCVFGSPSFWSPVDYSACRLLSEALGAISVNLTTVAISSSTLRAILDVPRNHVNISVGDLHATSAIFSNITKIVLDNRNNSRGNNGSGFIPLTNSAISNITLDLLISVSSVMSLSSTNGTSSFISIQQFQTETGRFPSPISPPPLFFSQPASPDNMISRIEGIGSLLIAGNSSVSLGNASLSVSVGGGIEIFGDGSFSSPDLQLFSVNMSAPTSGSPAEFLTVTSFGTGRDMSSGDTLTPPQFLSVDIPSSVFVQVQNQTNQPSTLFTFMTTPHTPLFTDTSLNPVTQFIGTPVVTLNFVVPQQNNSSSFVTASVTNLTTPIALSFTHGPIVNGSNNTRFIRSCVWYDYNSTDWRSEGCSVSFASVDSTGCECNHATSFAVLFSLDDSVSDSATLEIFTIIGCALSMAGTLFTFLTFTLIPSLRKPTLRPILCLCVSLFAVNLIFIVGVIPSSSTSVEGCRAAGALIHYFLLVTFALMFVIVIQLLRAIVFLVTDTERNFWTLFALCFSLPAIVVIICVAVDPSNYGGDRSCWINNRAVLLAAFVIPALIIVGLNSIMFIVIIKSLLAYSKESSGVLKRTSGLKPRQFFTIFFFVGISWVFGVLAMEGTASVFEYLFVIFNSLQGVAIFLLYCVNPKVFSEYKKAAGVVSSSIFTSTSTAGGTGNTSSGGGSAHSNSTISSIRYSGRGSSPASKSSRFNSVYSNDGSPQMFQVQNLAYLVARNPEMISSSSTYLSPSPTYSSSYVSSRYASSSSTAASTSVYNNDSIVQDDTAISISQKEESPSPLWALWADANKLARETGRPVADIYSELLNASSESDI